MCAGHWSALTKTLLLIWLPAVCTWLTRRLSSSQKCLVCNPNWKAPLIPTQPHIHACTEAEALQKQHITLSKGQTEGRAQRKNGLNSTVDRKTLKSGSERRNWCQLSPTIPTPTPFSGLCGVGMIKTKRGEEKIQEMSCRQRGYMCFGCCHRYRVSFQDWAKNCSNPNCREWFQAELTNAWCRWRRDLTLCLIKLTN